MTPTALAMPIRILHMVHTLGDGGADRALTRLVNASDPARYRHTILALTAGPGHEPLCRGVRCLTATIRGGMSRLPRRLAGEPFDVVHGWVSRASILAATYAAAAGVPLVLRNPTNMDMELRYEPALSDTYWPELKMAFGIADAVVVPSPALVDSTRRLCGVPSPTLIPNSVDVDAAEPWQPAPRDGRPFVLAAVGRLSPQKDPLTIIDAVGRIPDSVDWRLRLFGHGNLRDACEARAMALGIRDRVEFRGFDRGWLRADARIDAFVSATRYEGMSNALLEAAAAGMPIVTTAIPENLAVLEHGVHAMLVPVGNPTALASAITELAGLPDGAAAMGRRARQHMRRFSLGAMVAAHEALYSRLTRAHGAARAA